MFRVLVVLTVGLVVLLGVVVLRVEAARLEHQTSLLDREADTLKEDLRRSEVALTRLRNAQSIRDNVARMRLRRSPSTSQPAVSE